MWDKEQPPDGREACREKNCMRHFSSVACLDLQYFCHIINGTIGYRGSTVVKVLCYKWEGRWFDPS